MATPICECPSTSMIVRAGTPAAKRGATVAKIVEPEPVQACPSRSSSHRRLTLRGSGLCPDAASEQVRTRWPELWVQQYLWLHQDWSLAAEEALREVAQDIVGEVDPELSTVTVCGSRVDAVT
jgi:hypothetical protein